MNRRRSGFLIVFLVFIRFLTYGQLPDGVAATQSFLDTIRVNYKSENTFPFDLNSVSITANIPVRVHIVKNKKGLPGVVTTNLLSSVSLANSYFKNAGISFFIDSINYIDDYNYSYITFNELTKELLTKYKRSNRINLFVVDSIKQDNKRTYGFTYFPNEPDSNIIYLDKNYSTGSSLTAMLGHFMGLLSTHESGGGQELADESNCAASGDFICDTWADPGLHNQVIDSCLYIGTMKDNHSKYFLPSVANIMSDSPDKCKCILTPLQYRRIYYYYHKYRQYLNF